MTNTSTGSWNIIGHSGAIQFLQRALEQERLSHAYLFVGPPQVGKRTVAAELARVIVCTDAPRPCGKCRSCQLALGGHHPDITTVRGEGANGRILVDQIRDIRREASLSPVESRHRVYIICNMELANESAANALLKILEEPPHHVLFLLTTTAQELVLPTILSRCQIVFLHPQPREVIASALRDQWNASDEQAELLARLSGGRMGRALTMLQSDQMLSQRLTALGQLQQIVEQGWDRRFLLAEEIARCRPAKVQETLEIWVSWWRDILLLHENLPDRITNYDRETDLTQIYQSFAVDDIRSALHALQTCADCIHKNVGARLALEWLMVRLPVTNA